LIADVFTAVASSSVLSGVTSKLGGEYLDEHAVAPRMVWVLTHDSFTSGKRQTGPNAKSPRSTGTRQAGVRVRVWGKASVSNPTSVDEVRSTEDLVRRLLSAVHEKAYGNYEVGSIDWLAGDGQELLQYGRGCDVHLTFEIPIYRTTTEAGETTAPINTATQLGDIDFAGVPAS